MFKLGNMMSFIDVSVNSGVPDLGDILNGKVSDLGRHTYKYKHSKTFYFIKVSSLLWI